jgi:small-conductance mechanosensitive channel
MTSVAVPLQQAIVESTVNRFVSGVLDAAPSILSALLFLAIAYVVIRLLLMVLRSVLNRVYPDDQQLIANLFVTIAGVFLWFGAILAVLKLVGMGDIAASLGTAAGFIALGVSYALSEMIEDTVAGVYLLRDHDFNPGDTVEAASVTGTVKAIELRKSRIELDNGDTTVVANSDVEKRWTKIG